MSGSVQLDLLRLAGTPAGQRMIRIAITVEAYEAIAATLPLGTVAFEPQLNAKGERLIWIEQTWLYRLDAMRKAGESYSDCHLAARRTGGAGS